MIPVTKPFLPPIEDYQKYIDEIWDRNWLTNNGPLVNELELKLKEYLDIKHLLFLGNGTIAIQIAIKALNLTGKVITTPFSYVATTSSIVWEGLEPIFVDIDPFTFNINADLIEAAITPAVSAILATHCFGNACNIEKIEFIAKKHNLKVIYDAAHCFGTKYNGKSIFEFGDISTTSFHATKLFHTIEGGAVFSRNNELIKAMTCLRNFGHNGPEKFSGIGINGKNSEFHAAMGLCNLKYIRKISEIRKKQFLFYSDNFRDLSIKGLSIQENCEFNYAYYPIIFESENILIKVKNALEEKSISPRRYFYPTLSSLPYVKGKFNTPIADYISQSVLCLPLYFELKESEQEFIISIIRSTLQNV